MCETSGSSTNGYAADNVSDSYMVLESGKTVRVRIDYWAMCFPPWQHETGDFDVRVAAYESTFKEPPARPLPAATDRVVSENSVRVCLLDDPAGARYF